jgi:hypothetical protein
MLGALRNSITGLLGRSGLGGVRAKSTTGLAIASFSRCGHRGARNLDASTKYGMSSAIRAKASGRQPRLRRRSLVSKRQARALGRRKQR